MQRHLSATLVPSPFTAVTESETPLVSETARALQNRFCTAVLRTLAPTCGRVDWLQISLQIQLTPWQSEQPCSLLRSRLVTEKKHSKCVLTLFYKVGTTTRRMSSMAVTSSPHDGMKPSCIIVVRFNPEASS